MESMFRVIWRQKPGPDGGHPTTWALHPRQETDRRSAEWLKQELTVHHWDAKIVDVEALPSYGHLQEVEPPS